MPSSQRLLFSSKSGEAMSPDRERGNRESRYGTPKETKSAYITFLKLRSCNSSLKSTTLRMSYSHSPAASTYRRLKNCAKMAAVCLVLVKRADNRDCRWQMSLAKLWVPSYRETASRESSLVCCLQSDGRTQFESILTSKLAANLPIFWEASNSSTSTDTTGESSLLPAASSDCPRATNASYSN